MKKLFFIAVVIAAAYAIFYLAVYKKEGPIEEFGRKLDEGFEDIQHGDETTLEKASRKINEIADDVKKEFEEK